MKNVRCTKKDVERAVVHLRLAFADHLETCKRVNDRADRDAERGASESRVRVANFYEWCEAQYHWQVADALHRAFTTRLGLSYNCDDDAYQWYVGTKTQNETYEKVMARTRHSVRESLRYNPNGRVAQLVLWAHNYRNVRASLRSCKK